MRVVLAGTRRSGSIVVASAFQIDSSLGLTNHELHEADRFLWLRGRRNNSRKQNPRSLCRSRRSGVLAIVSDHLRPVGAPRAVHASVVFIVIAPITGLHLDVIQLEHHCGRVVTMDHDAARYALPLFFPTLFADHIPRQHAFELLLDPSESATEPHVVLPSLKKLCARGIADRWRPLAWEVLVGVRGGEKREWAKAEGERVRGYYVSPLAQEGGFLRRSGGVASGRGMLNCTE